MKTRWTVRAVPAIGLVAQLGLLAALAATAGLGEAGWRVGVACALIMATALGRGLARSRAERLGLASGATLARGTLAVGVAALVADSFARPTPVALLVALAAVALVLDAVDGPLARRTGTETPLGARFDGEVDAFLILALSVYVARSDGTWVLAIGALRYVFLAGEWLLPWMRAPLPPRRWRRAVAAAQGIVLTVAAAGILPGALTKPLLAAALAALAASMGECAWWLWRRRAQAPERAPLPADIAVGLTVLALALVWAALVAPDQPGKFTLGAFARVPVELLVVVILAVLSPPALRRGLVAVAGVLLSALVLVKLLDVGFFMGFDRRFDPVDDSGYLGTGIDTLRIGVGAARAYLAVAGIAVVALGLLSIPALALWRVTRVAAGHRGWALRAAAVLGVLWLALRVAGAPVASSSATALATQEVQAVRAGLHDHAVFAPQIAHDRFAKVPGNRLLTGLRGKDVLVVFVESYGQVAVQGSTFSPPIDALLRTGTAQLQAAGFSSRSAFLTSPTFGGLSWLAHSTLQSGLQVNGRRRYAQLVHSRRLTLTTAFKKAGWRVVGVMPADRQDWPEGRSFYHYETIYSGDSLGYRGRSLGLYKTPDQYVFHALQEHELAKPHHRPVFAEIDTVSSHFPWEQIPRILPWSQLGDGTIYDRVPALQFPRSAPFADAGTAQAAYGRSIQYAMGSLISFMRRYGGRNTVMILLGDHQPWTFVSGDDATHNVPVSIIARDPKVMQQIAGWGWDAGLLPSPQAPVAPMASFRDRFLSTFSAR
jgi:phosphatidylglycerophosphate synthase